MEWLNNLSYDDFFVITCWQVIFSIASQSVETSENTSKKLQNKMESLQNQVETLQRKSQAMSSMIRTQEMKTEKAKEKEKKLSKWRLVCISDYFHFSKFQFMWMSQSYRVFPVEAGNLDVAPVNTEISKCFEPHAYNCKTEQISSYTIIPSSKMDSSNGG